MTAGTQLRTLPDYLKRDLRILSIGLNPSVRSVEAGYYFANPRNRFWKALNASDLVPEPLEPGRVAVETLFTQYDIGFTDVVKRATSSGSQLRAADFRKWGPVLDAHIKTNRPRVAWFHGKVAYSRFVKYVYGVNETVDWGGQTRLIHDSRVYVTPNPSPANAVFSLSDLTQWYDELMNWVEGL